MENNATRRLPGGEEYSRKATLPLEIQPKGTHGALPYCKPEKTKKKYPLGAFEEVVPLMAFRQPAIIIASLGLFGLTAYLPELRLSGFRYYVMPL